MIVRILPLLAAFLMWAAFKPIGIGLLIFPAAFCWLIMAAWPGQLPRHSYKLLYIGSFIAWLALLQGIRLAYWPLYLGWVALAFYVAFYIPLFVFSTRYLIFRWRWPLAIAAPVVWTGCELLRCYVMTGFGGCLLSHAMARHPMAIQLASHIGPHLLSGFYVFVAATVLDFCRMNTFFRTRIWSASDNIVPFASHLDRVIPGTELSPSDETTIVPANRSMTKIELVLQSCIIVVATIFSIALYYQGRSIEANGKPLLKVGLIQENAETRFEINEERAANSYARYRDLTAQAGKANPDLDLLVWPESIYSLRFVYFDWDGQPLPNAYAPFVGEMRTAFEDAKAIQRMHIGNVRQLQRIAGGGGLPNMNPPAQSANAAPPNLPALLLGASLHRIRKTGFHAYNSAVFQPKNAGPIEFYDKRKLVMFGEYIPFARNFPEVYEKLRMMELSVGRQWIAFDVNDVKIAPSICFEDMLPQAMQDQTATLSRSGDTPDILINVTNDGWFRGSSMLDHHFACAIFSAVENRRPMLVSANTGISGWISGNGQVVAESEKLEASVIVAKPTADARWGLWQSVGDWPARACAAVVVATLLVMVWRSQVKSYYDRRNESVANAQSS